MARVHHLSSSRVAHQCKAGHEIPAGEAYSWAAPGFRARKRYACAKHPFRPSELTTSLASQALAAAEAFEDALDQIEHSSPDALADISAARDELESEIEGYAQEREAALDAWENGNSQLEELNDIAQAALDEIVSWQVEEWDGDEEARDNEDHADHEEALAAWEDHVADQVEAARDLAGLEF